MTEEPFRAETAAVHIQIFKPGPELPQSPLESPRLFTFMATPAAAATSAPPAPFAGGELVFIGGTDWSQVGPACGPWMLRWSTI